MDTATILIVDDIPANIFALENLLEKEGRIFLSAINGNDALKLALSQPVDLIILDVQMSGMDGFEVAQVLKSNKKTKDVPVIFASAAMKEHISLLKGYEEGAVDYLVKPLDPDITRAKVSMFLLNQAQKRELIAKNQSLEKSALLINNSMDILGVMDAETLLFEEVNNALTVTLGYSQEEIKTFPITLFMNDNDVNRMQEMRASSKDKLSFETEFRTKNGEKKWIQWHITAKEKKWFVNARDITSQKFADDKILQLNTSLQDNLKKLELINKELESFSYSVSHDLRAPLRSINGYSKILDEEYREKLDEGAKRLLATIQRNAHKMGDLIDDLLEFSKLGRQELRKSKVNMNELVSSLLKEELKYSHSFKYNLIVHPLQEASVDKALISQVWINLLSNAIKYSSKKMDAQVEVGSQDKESEIVYYVKDNGAGFDPKYAYKLFSVFQRLHSSDDFEGTGIGLAIVQRIVARHGGRVWAESQPDQGATFYFSLPT